MALKCYSGHEDWINLDESLQHIKVAVRGLKLYGRDSLEISTHFCPSAFCGAVLFGEAALEPGVGVGVICFGEIVPLLVLPEIVHCC